MEAALFGFHGSTRREESVEEEGREGVGLVLRLVECVDNS